MNYYLVARPKTFFVDGIEMQDSSMQRILKSLAFSIRDSAEAMMELTAAYLDKPQDLAMCETLKNRIENHHLLVNDFNQLDALINPKN